MSQQPPIPSIPSYIPPPGPPQSPATYSADADHLKLLAIFYYIMAGLQGAGTLFALIFITMGMMFDPKSPFNDPRAPEMVPVFFGCFIGCFGVLGIVVTVLNLLAARGLQTRRRRAVIYTAAVLHCLSIPGIILAIFTFIVMGRPSVKAMFDGPGT